MRGKGLKKSGLALGYTQKVGLSIKAKNPTF
jgi:hypothetical protein